MTDSLFEDLRWRDAHRHHPGLGRVGVSLGEGQRILLALAQTVANIDGLATKVSVNPRAQDHFTQSAKSSRSRRSL
jgi:hypothetical protein